MSPIQDLHEALKSHAEFATMDISGLLVEILKLDGESGIEMKNPLGGGKKYFIDPEIREGITFSIMPMEATGNTYGITFSVRPENQSIAMYVIGRHEKGDPIQITHNLTVGNEDTIHRIHDLMPSN